MKHQIHNNYLLIFRGKKKNLIFADPYNITANSLPQIVRHLWGKITLNTFSIQIKRLSKIDFYISETIIT